MAENNDDTYDELNTTMDDLQSSPTQQRQQSQYNNDDDWEGDVSAGDDEDNTTDEINTNPSSSDDQNQSSPQNDEATYWKEWVQNVQSLVSYKRYEEALYMTGRSFVIAKEDEQQNWAEWVYRSMWEDDIATHGGIEGETNQKFPLFIDVQNDDNPPAPQSPSNKMDVSSFLHNVSISHSANIPQPQYALLRKLYIQLCDVYKSTYRDVLFHIKFLHSGDDSLEENDNEVGSEEWAEKVVQNIIFSIAKSASMRGDIEVLDILFYTPQQQQHETEEEEEQRMDYGRFSTPYQKMEVLRMLPPTLQPGSYAHLIPSLFHLAPSSYEYEDSEENQRKELEEWFMSRIGSTMKMTGQVDVALELAQIGLGKLGIENDKEECQLHEVIRNLEEQLQLQNGKKTEFNGEGIKVQNSDRISETQENTAQGNQPTFSSPPPQSIKTTSYTPYKTPMSSTSDSSSSSALQSELQNEKLKSAKLKRRIEDLTDTIHALEEETCSLNEQLANTSPTKVGGGADSPMASPKFHSPTPHLNGGKSDDDDMKFNKTIMALEEALRTEVKRRTTLEQKVYQLQNQQSKEEKKQAVIDQTKQVISQIQNITNCIQEMSFTQSSASPNNASITRQMMDYEELMTCFMLENTEIDHDHEGEDGEEEMMSRKDVMWFLNECKWRFDMLKEDYVQKIGSVEDGLFGVRDDLEVVLNRFVTEEEEIGGEMEDIDDVVQEEVKEKKNQFEDRMKIDNNTECYQQQQQIAKERESLQQIEIEKLNNRICELEEMVGTLTQQNNDMAAAATAASATSVETPQTQTQQQSQAVEQVQNEVCQGTNKNDSDDTTTIIESLKNQLDSLRQTSEENEKKYALARDGDRARIKYLEEMVRNTRHALEASRRGRRRSSMSGSGAIVSMDPRVEEQDGFPSMIPSPSTVSPPPSSPLNPNIVRAIALSSPADISTNNNYDGSESVHHKMAALAHALECSENQRAVMLEQFQKERESYATKFRELNDLLKTFVSSEVDGVGAVEGNYGNAI